MVTRVIKKNLAGMEDLLQGIGTEEQARGEDTFTISKIDVPLATATTAVIKALDPTIFTRARLYTGESGFNDLVYDATATEGIASDSVGFWVLLNNQYNLVYLGLWSELSGALAKGKTVGYDNNLWTSKVALLDVSASIPSGTNDDWELQSDIVNKNSVKGLQDLQGKYVGEQVVVSFFHDIIELKGGGTFVWTPNVRHNGGTIIDPNRTHPDWSNQTEVLAWFNDSGSDANCWVRKDVAGEIALDWFGARGTTDMRDISNSFDSTQSIIAASKACLVTIPKSSTPGDDEVIWGRALTISEGLFRIREQLLTFLTAVTESVTFRGVGRMSRLLWDPSATSATNRDATGLFDVDLVRYGEFTNFSILAMQDNPGHGFDLGNCAKTTFRAITTYLTAGVLPASPDEPEYLIVNDEDIVYSFRNNKSGDSILNTYINVRVGDAASLNNGFYGPGAQGVRGWGDDETLTGGVVTLNGSKWIGCSVESTYSAVSFTNVSAIQCNMEILAEGMWNEFYVFPTLQATALPTGTIVTNVLTSNDALPSNVTVGKYVLIESGANIHSTRRITNVAGNAITVDYGFDFDEAVTFSIINVPVVALQGFSSSIISVYIESSITSHPTARLALHNMRLRGCDNNRIVGYADAFSGVTACALNKFSGSFNGLAFSGDPADNRLNDTSEVVTNSSTWSISGIHTSARSTNNLVGPALSSSNNTLVGRMPECAVTPSSDAGFDYHQYVFPTAADLTSQMYITSTWAAGGDALKGIFFVDVISQDTSGSFNANAWAIVHNDGNGNLTIKKTESSTGSVSLSVVADSGDSNITLNNPNGDKKFTVRIKRSVAESGLYGVVLE